MSGKLDKLAVLMALKQYNAPISSTALLQKLSGGIAERTLRRWLDDLVREGVVLKTGAKRATRYSAKQPPTVAENLRLIHQPVFERTPVSYQRDWLQAYVPNESAYIPKAIQDYLAKVGQRSQNKDPAGTYAHKIYQRLLIDLSYNSSRLEGNTYSLLETEKLILEGQAVPGKLDTERVMILNHKDAIRHLVDQAAHLKINVEEICTLHYLLADGLVPNQYAGKLRDHGIRISGSTYLPLETKQQLTDVLTIAGQMSRPFLQKIKI